MKKSGATRSFLLLLYAESVEEQKRNEKIFQILDGAECVKYVAIKHDKDVKIPDSDEEKKEHIHALLTFPFQRSVKSVAESLNLDERFIRACHDKHEAELYLIHLGYFQKYQYDVSELFGSDKESAMYRILRAKRGCVAAESETSLDEALQFAMNLIEAGRDYKLGITKKWFLGRMNEAGLLSQAIRLYPLLRDMIDEHNRFVGFNRNEYI